MMKTLKKMWKQAKGRFWGMGLSACLGLMMLAVGCGGGEGGGTSSSHDKARPNFSLPSQSNANKLDTTTREEAASRSYYAYELSWGSVDWWVLTVQPGVNYQIVITPARGDQDLYVYVNDRWYWSENWGLSQDWVTFRALAWQTCYIAVYGYTSGSYRIAGYYW